MSEEFVPVSGVRLGSARAGIKYRDRADLVMVETEPGSTAAAVFTRNAFCAAPVVLARRHLATASPRYLLINSGNANAGTGDPGLADAEACCAAAASVAGCIAEEVLPFSTGVIGEPLPMDRILAAIPQAYENLSESGWGTASRAIMTTDTRPKLVSRQLELMGRTITVTGMAKGAGMICPDMATMLAFVATDAQVDRDLLQDGLQRAVEGSFNAISIDGDTSTNDACVLLATGSSGCSVRQSADVDALFSVIDEVCRELAHEIVRDGEGATRLADVQVQGARSGEEARQVAYTIAHSPLVKTALFAADPNWGRILAAVGRSGLEELDILGVDIFLDEVRIVHRGARDPEYTEASGASVMRRPEFAIRVVLGRGSERASVLTCDLSYDYVRINAEYRT
jgi:glutamate N-acetyltransferase/amino-acid N-acetyltransferase